MTREVPLAISMAEKGGAAVYAVDPTEISLSGAGPSGDAQPEVYLHHSHCRVLRRTLELAFTLASI